MVGAISKSSVTGRLNVELPLDRERREKRCYSRAVLEVKILVSAHEACERAAAVSGSSPDSLWIASLAVLLHHYGNEPPLLLGSSMGGDLMRLWPLQVAPTNSFADLVAAVESLRKEPGFDGFTRSAIKPVSTALPLLHAGYAAEGVVCGVGWTEAAELVLDLSAGRASPRLIYNEDLLSRETVHCVAGHLAHVIEQAVRAPHLAIRDFELMTTIERKQMSQRWESDAVDIAGEGLIAERIARHAATIPNAPAIAEGALRLSYAELNAHANRLAHFLLASSPRPNERIGVCIERSTQCVIAQLAVLKIGGAVVLMEPDQPAPWLHAMVRRCGAECVISTSAHAAKLPEVDLILLDRDHAAIGQASADNPALAVAPSLDAAEALVGTSGSTGKPKIVIGRHRALNNMIHWTRAALGAGPGARATWVASPGYGLCRVECWCYLANGAEVYIADAATVGSPERMHEWLGANRITHTSQMTLMAERLWRLPPPAGGALTVMLIAGERLREWPPIGLPYEVFNNYGSTEATIVAGGPLVALARSLPEDDRLRRPPPAGTAIPNVRAYVVDEQFRVLPAGVRGELLVAGCGLARGYSNTELTQQRFLANPIAGVDEKLLYRTGDAARYRQDGSLEILGRLDDEVKILGARANVSDVTRLCARLEGVEEAAVTSFETVDGTAQLVAYVVPAAGHPFDAERLRDAALRQVPVHMVPRRFVALDTLPLLPNGKVDGEKLRRLNLTPAVKVRGDRPRGPVEELIAKQWSQLLKTDVASVADNFFDHGGHSLLALDLLSEIRNFFGVDIGISQLNGSPTIAGIARLVEQALIDTRRGSAAASTAGFGELVHDAAHRFDPFPLTEMQQALWVGRTSAVEMGGVGCLGYFEWDCRALSPDALERAWQALVDRHDALRTVCTPDGLQRTLRSVPPYRIDRIDLRGADSAAQAARLAELRESLSRTVFPADSWPLFRIAACQLTDECTRVIMGIDLLILDAWSYFRILIPELVKLLEGCAPFPPLELTFRDYVCKMDAELEASAAFERARNYWLARLPDLPPGPQLPMAAARDVDRPVLFGSRTHRIPRSCWQRMKASAFLRNTTPTVMLTAVFCDVLRDASGVERFTLNLPIFAREPLHPQVLGIVGDFTTTVLLAADKFDGSFAERAQALQQQLWEDLEHRHFSGIRVVRELIRTGRHAMGASMPVVVTSLLDQVDRADTASLGVELKVLSQTPQVLLDLQLRECEGDLLIHWSIVEGVVSSDGINAMFQSYLRRLDRLIEDDAAWEAERLDAPLTIKSCEMPRRDPTDLATAPRPLGDPALEAAVGALAEAFFDSCALGRDDDLFRAGVDSLGIIRWIGRLNELFGVELPLQRVFEQPTIAGVCGLLVERDDWRDRTVATARKLEVLTLDDLARMVEAHAS